MFGCRCCGVVAVVCCVCTLDLESDGVAGVVKVMRGPRERWLKMISTIQPPATQTHETGTIITPDTFLFRMGNGSQAENKPPHLTFIPITCVYTVLVLGTSWMKRVVSIINHCVFLVHM